jgi:hypothetical protein
MTPPFLTLAVDGGELSASRPGRFALRRKPPPPVIHAISGWVGPTAGLDAVEFGQISFPCWESNPGRTISSPSLYRLTNPDSL